MEKIEPAEELPNHLTVNSDGSLLCIAYHYADDGITIWNQESNEIMHTGVTHCSQLGRICISNNHLYVAEKGQIYKINFKGELITRFGTLDSIISCLAIGADGLLYVGNYNRGANFQGVLVYKTNGNFSHVLCRNIHPVDIAFDEQENTTHICDNRSNSVRVYNSKGKLTLEYGKHHLRNPMRIGIHPNDFYIVLESVSLLVFSQNGSFLYEIDLDQHGILDFAITNDGSLWLVDNYFKLIKQQPHAFFTPPPSLKLLCQSTVLLNMADLPTSLLPYRYLNAIKSWSKVVQYEINNKDTSKHGKLQIPPELTGQALAMILEEKLGVSYTVLSDRMKYDNKTNKVVFNMSDTSITLS